MDMNTAMAATEAFLAQMRREWIKIHGLNQECPVKTLEAYEGSNRGALLRSIEQAVSTASKTARI